jgi:carbamate kinase
MLVVVAVGHDVLRPGGDAVDAPEEQAAVDEAAGALAALAEEHHLVLACGWGSHAGVPPLGDIVGGGVPTYPLEVLDSEAERSAAHRFEQAVARRLPPDRLATVVARVVVDADDPAFVRPATPVGPLFDFPEAERLARAHGWVTRPDGGGVGWRRVVASPAPRAIAELATFRILVDGGATVLWPVHAALPVVRTPPGTLRWVEAVVGADLAAARLASDLDADALLVLESDGPAGDTPGVGAVREDAVRAFVTNGGWLGAIVPPADASAVLSGGAAPMAWGPGAGAGAGPAVPVGRP